MVAVTLDQEKKAAEAGEPLPKCLQEPAGLHQAPKPKNFWFYILPQLDSSFLCLSLRTGTQIIGWFHVVTSLITTVMFSGIVIGLFLISYSEDIKEKDKPLIQYYAIFFSLLLLLILPVVIFSIRLLVGVHQRKPELMKPFLVLLYVYMFLDIFVWFTEIEFGVEDSDIKHYVPNARIYRPCNNILMTLCRFVSEFYTILVVNSYHRELKSQNFGYRPQV